MGCFFHLSKTLKHPTGILEQILGWKIFLIFFPRMSALTTNEW